MLPICQAPLVLYMHYLVTYSQQTHELDIFVTPLKYIYIKVVHTMVKVNQMKLKGS